MWLLLPFVVLPIIEIALFIQVGGAIGVLPVIALVLASAFAGVAIMRRQGARAALDVQQAMREVGDPTRPMAHGALRMIGCSGALASGQTRTSFRTKIFRSGNFSGVRIGVGQTSPSSFLT